MSLPRVFISHGAGGDAGILALLDAIKESLQSQFSVLIDKDDIDPGDDWQAILDRWVGDCHAAVILLTERALARSWVQTEASILTFRHRYGSCLLVPVFLDAVNEDAVRQSPLAATRILEIQGIKGGTHEETVQRVGSALAALSSGTIKVQGQYEYVRQKLSRSLTPEFAGKLSVQLGLEARGWKSDPHRDLTFALLQERDFRKIAATVKLIRGYMQEKAEVYNLFEIVASAWVELAAVETLCRQASGEREKRAVAVNAVSATIAECYIKRAAVDRLPIDGWTVASITGVFGDKPLEKLEEDVRRELLATFHLTDHPEKLAQKLDDREWEGDPVFVALPGGGLDRPILQHLREVFPTVTFFALAGDDAFTRETLSRSGVTVLKPDLETGFEERFCEFYDRTRRNLNLP